MDKITDRIVFGTLIEHTMVRLMESRRALGCARGTRPHRFPRRRRFTMAESTISRRDLLKGGLAAGVGLTVAVYLDGCVWRDVDPPATDAPFAPDAWIRLGTDGTVTVVVDRSEMGRESPRRCPCWWRRSWTRIGRRCDSSTRPCTISTPIRWPARSGRAEARACAQRGRAAGRRARRPSAGHARTGRCPDLGGARRELQDGTGVVVHPATGRSAATASSRRERASPGPPHVPLNTRRTSG